MLKFDASIFGGELPVGLGVVPAAGPRECAQPLPRDERRDAGRLFGEGCLGGTEPHLDEPDRRHGGEISLVHGDIVGLEGGRLRLQDSRLGGNMPSLQAETLACSRIGQ
jgi:hypothetical protein